MAAANAALESDLPAVRAPGSDPHGARCGGRRRLGLRDLDAELLGDLSRPRRSGLTEPIPIIG